MIGHRDMHDATPFVGEDHEHEQQGYVAVGTTKKSVAAIWPTWFARNVRHVCDGGRRRLTMYFATVD